MSMEKKELRRFIRQKLAEHCPQERAAKGMQICQYVQNSELFQNTSVVMAFLPMVEEVDTVPIILHAWQQGKTIVVPKILDQRHIIPIEIQSLDTGVEIDRYGLRNPISEIPFAFEEIDLVLTPGLGFDRRGNRLGRGRAYYDRFFSNPKLRAIRWALTFSFQVLDRIPVDERDMPVDAIVTETGIYPCINEVSRGG